MNHHLTNDNVESKIVLNRQKRITIRFKKKVLCKQVVGDWYFV